MKNIFKQMSKFISRILENLPDLTSEEIQYWIESPKKLRIFLGGLRTIAQQELSQCGSIKELHGMLIGKPENFGFNREMTGFDFIESLDSLGIVTCSQADVDFFRKSYINQPLGEMVGCWMKEGGIKMVSNIPTYTDVGCDVTVLELLSSWKSFPHQNMLWAFKKLDAA